VSTVAPGWQRSSAIWRTHWDLIQDIAVSSTARQWRGKQLPPEQTLRSSSATPSAAIACRTFRRESISARLRFRWVAGDEQPHGTPPRLNRLPLDRRRLQRSFTAVDVAHAHLPAVEATIDEVGTGTTLKGEYSASVDLFGIQLTFTFDDGLPFFS
jgi:hypothetical protein